MALANSARGRSCGSESIRRRSPSVEPMVARLRIPSLPGQDRQECVDCDPSPIGFDARQRSSRGRPQRRLILARPGPFAEGTLWNRSFRNGLSTRPFPLNRGSEIALIFKPCPLALRPGLVRLAGRR